ncbi:hypothetical protein BD410DRAFT_792878 [Rickenella mellea]|uniref:RING-type domain-containing protein n=1 Tax=Rickenella mellea TaxID=50990 RepID=A0A4Y7PTJ5_9AGAM|nr:hypothetical protein BD410DRAFT_792878 [Rickenella mellea]
MAVICSICFDECGLNHSAVALECGHIFGAVCLQQHRSVSTDCPCCRQTIDRRAAICIHINASPTPMSSEHVLASYELLLGLSLQLDSRSAYDALPEGLVDKLQNFIDLTVGIESFPRGGGNSCSTPRIHKSTSPRTKCH